jgi:O-methyltransferase
MYLDLLKNCLTRYNIGETYGEVRRPVTDRRKRWAVLAMAQRWLATHNLAIVRQVPFDPDMRVEGLDWPAQAETMIGLKRLQNLEDCVTDILVNGVPGDLIETGAWRGGACILMRALLKVYGDTTRKVWVADSFEGLPKPDGRYPQDAGDRLWKNNAILGVSLEQVKANFTRYGLLDSQVEFLKGWFKDTLPVAPIQRLAILRLDGDMYASTADALNSLYAKLSPGGYVIIDDYGVMSTCKQAVDDFRVKHGVTEEMRWIDRSGVFWRRHV